METTFSGRNEDDYKIFLTTFGGLILTLNTGVVRITKKSTKKMIALVWDSNNEKANNNIEIQTSLGQGIQIFLCYI